MTKANAVSVGKVSRVSCRSASTAKGTSLEITLSGSEQDLVRLTFDVGSIIWKVVGYALVADPHGHVRHVWCGAEVRRASRVFERQSLHSGTVTALAALRSSSGYRARWKTLRTHARSDDIDCLVSVTCC